MIFIIINIHVITMIERNAIVAFPFETFYYSFYVSHILTFTEAHHLQQLESSEPNIYSQDPTDKTFQENVHTTTDSGVDENEYLTPETARLRRLTPSVVYNKAFQFDEENAGSGAITKKNQQSNQNQNKQAVQQTEPVISKEDAALYHVQQSVSEAKMSTPKSRKHSRKSDRRSRKGLGHGRENETEGRNRNHEINDEIPEYSTPKSNRSSVEKDEKMDGKHSTTVTDSSTSGTASFSTISEEDEREEDDEDEDHRPAVPPRPKVRPISGLYIRGSLTVESDDNPYTKMNKKSRSNKSKSQKGPEDNTEKSAPTKLTALAAAASSATSSNALNKSTNSNTHVANTNSSLKSGIHESDTRPLEPPARRKRPRRRSSSSKHPQAPIEEDVYDGTKDYEDLEVDPSFYTDLTKTRIRRSSRIPAIQPDLNDTRYWITVTNDY